MIDLKISLIMCPTERTKITLIGDIKKNLLDANADTEWQNLTLSLGLTAVVSQPTCITAN